MPNLTIELVPKTVWYKNLRSELTSNEWDALRKDCYKKAGYLCEICGGKGPKWPIECHEIWEFDDQFRTQTLVGLIGLCPDCHEVKHIGLAGVKGRAREAREHLSKITGMSDEEAGEYINRAFLLWEARSKHQWELDISWATR